jgi:uncharacterized protein
MLDSKILGERIDYTGDQLRSHFVREKAGITADGVVAFRGACAVTGARPVDLEDAEQHSSIIAEDMLHFIGEHFECTLREANYRLRLFVCILAECIRETAPGLVLKREGDDLYVVERKLTVAIATVTPVSTVFHCGVNVDPAGAPVPAVGLEELGVDAEKFAAAVLRSYRDECLSIDVAIRKVRGVT